MKISTNYLYLEHLGTGQIYQPPISDKFSDSRSILSGYSALEKLMRNAPKTLKSAFGWFIPAPSILIHPLAVPENGFSEIELRALLELGYAAGARQCYIYIGKELSHSEVYAEIKKAPK